MYVHVPYYHHPHHHPHCNHRMTNTKSAVERKRKCPPDHAASTGSTFTASWSTKRHKELAAVSPAKATRLHGCTKTRQTTEANKNGLKQDQFVSNPDVLSHIMSFLDVKSLHKFTLSSKKCRNLLRPDHVVLAALFQGGRARTNIERIIQIFRDDRQRIYTPSALRMLQLCNGRRCENCQTSRVHLVSQHWGVFFCRDCQERRGYVVTLKRFDPLYPRVSHLHTIPDGCHAIRIWAKPLVDRRGERCGPRLTLHQDPATDLTEENNLSQEQEQQEETTRRESFLPLVEKTYRDHVEEADDRRVMERISKHMASLAAQEKKMQRIQWVFRELERGLGNVPWKQEMLAHEWLAVPNRNKERIQFSAPLAQQILGRDLATPSKLTKTRIQELVAQLRSAMCLFEECRLHDFGFFESNPPNKSQVAFRELCLETFPCYSLLSRKWVHWDVLLQLRHLHPPNRASVLHRCLSAQVAIDTESS